MESADSPVRRELRSLLLAALFMLAGTGTSWPAEPRQPLLAGGIEIFYGVIPAEIILGHPADHAERKMHGGVPGGSGQHHLILSLFDAKTRQRITDAAVTAKVSEAGLGEQQRKLEAMRMGNDLTYGNYFRMSGAGPYRIEVEILRRGSAAPVTTTFAYSHPRR